MTTGEDGFQPRMQQLVDWEAAAWAGFAASILSFCFAMLFFDSTQLLRVLAGSILGENLPPGFSVEALFAGMGLHILMSILFALLIAFILHRWGFIIGIIGGGLMGLILYGFNFYAVPQFLPGLIGDSADLLITMLQDDWRMGLVHVVFGALAGGIYEWLEVEEYVPTSFTRI